LSNCIKKAFERGTDRKEVENQGPDFRHFCGACSIRLRNDIKAFLHDPLPNVRIYWSKEGRALVVGLKLPDHKLFGAGRIFFRLDFTEEFPMTPPSMTFTSRIFHPNVYFDGTANVTILKPENWQATHSLSEIVANITNELFERIPTFDAIANHYAAQLYNTDLQKFKEIATHCIRQSSEVKRKEKEPDEAAKKETKMFCR